MRSRVWDDYISERHVENAGAETEDGMRVGEGGAGEGGEAGGNVNARPWTFFGHVFRIECCAVFRAIAC